MPGGRSISAASAADASMNAAAITAPPNTTIPSGGGMWAPPSRTRMPGTVQAAIVASLACQTGRDDRAPPTVACGTATSERLGDRRQRDQDEEDDGDAEREGQD